MSPASPPWSLAAVPDLTGRTALVTGASTGIGLETARILAGHGATVILACRNRDRADRAATRIRTGNPAATLDIVDVDLTSQASIRRAADEVHTRYSRLDLLINNAGASFARRTATADGFENTLATNHLGPFALTGLLIDLMLTTPGSRIVTVSSVGHKRGVVNFDDLHHSTGYRASTAYFQSKLANLLFHHELQRRLAASDAETISVAAHPGNARTEFGRDMPLFVRVMTSPRIRLLTWWLMQDPAPAALSVVRAAVDPDANGGDYYGPGGFGEFTGNPEIVQPSPAAHDPAVQHRLWAESERLTAVTYPIADSGSVRTTSRAE